MDLENKFRHVLNFPKDGIDFIDITTVLQDPIAYRYVIDCLVDEVKDIDFDLVICSEARGFILGAPVAYILRKGFVPIRKWGKLPYETIKEKYVLEYRSDTLEIHIDAIKQGQKVIIIDDILATGGTIAASIKLVEKLGGIVEKVLFLAELKDLSSRNLLDNYNVSSLVKI